MGCIKDMLNYQTIKVREDDEICFIQINRPDHNNTINDLLIEEISIVLHACEKNIKVIVLEGLPDVFCFGADFKSLQEDFENGTLQNQSADKLYALWIQLANGPYVTVAHVRGKVNAGGVGFVAACDIVLCEDKAVFSLSELVFGLMPACVLPFLIRRIGFSRANYMTLMTQPVSSEQAREWGLVDATEENSVNLLRKHLLRLRRISKRGITRYKRFMVNMDSNLSTCKDAAIQGNKEVFSDAENLEKISLYVKTGKFPWE